MFVTSPPSNSTKKLISFYENIIYQTVTFVTLTAKSIITCNF